MKLKIRYSCSCGNTWSLEVGASHPNKERRCTKCKEIASYCYIREQTQ